MEDGHRFRSSEEATRFGSAATEKDKVTLRLARAIYTAQYNRLRDKRHQVLKTCHNMQVLKIQIKYCSEALAAAKLPIATGINKNNDGTYTAITLAKSKVFKTLNGAQKWMRQHTRPRM